MVNERNFVMMLLGGGLVCVWVFFLMLEFTSDTSDVSINASRDVQIEGGNDPNVGEQVSGQQEEQGDDSSNIMVSISTPSRDDITPTQPYESSDLFEETQSSTGGSQSNRSSVGDSQSNQSSGGENQTNQSPTGESQTNQSSVDLMELDSEDFSETNESQNKSTSEQTSVQEQGAIADQSVDLMELESTDYSSKRDSDRSSGNDEYNIESGNNIPPEESSDLFDTDESTPNKTESESSVPQQTSEPEKILRNQIDEEADQFEPRRVSLVEQDEISLPSIESEASLQEVIPENAEDNLTEQMLNTNLQQSGLSQDTQEIPTPREPMDITFTGLGSESQLVYFILTLI